MQAILTTIGLGLDIAGVVCLGWITPKGSIATIGETSTPMVPTTTSAKWASKLGWWALGIGFLLQAVGQWV